MKINTLTGAALDWAVAKCEGDDMRMGRHENPRAFVGFLAQADYYAESWALGGPIIEREKISLKINHTGWFLACIYSINDDAAFMHSGHTPLIAAMRCYIASKIGDCVDVPDEVAKGGAL
jgi:hypothetical protein